MRIERRLAEEKGRITSETHLERFIMPTDPRMKEFEAYWKTSKWKKIVNFFYMDINDETIAHFQPLYRGSLLRIQAGVTNRRLNRVSWDITGVTACKLNHVVKANSRALDASNAEALERRRVAIRSATSRCPILETMDLA